MKKRIICICCVLAVLFTFTTGMSSGTNEKDLQTDEKIVEEISAEEEVFMANQSKSLETYYEIEKDIKKNKDTYAGVYIDDDGNLNILSTGNIDSYKRRAARAKVSANQQIIYRTVEYSYEYLDALKDRLWSIRDELYISEIAVDEIKNKVEVVYYREEFNKKAVINAAGDENELIFMQSEGPVQSEAAAITL